MNSHNFLISSTRPGLLFKQVSTFLKISSCRKLKFYVFNDGHSKNADFLVEIDKLKKYNPNVGVYYFDLNTQVKIIKGAASKYASAVNVKAKSIINCFKENGKMRGIRSIQNKSVFIFYLINKDKKSIVHKIDDDIFPYEANRRGEAVEIIMKQNFFEQKEASINGNRKIISGNNYTIDSPSPLVNYTDFTEFLFNFYDLARGKSENEKIGKAMLNISPTKVRRIFDRIGILDIPPIGENLTYKKAVCLLTKYAKLIGAGNSRVIINDNKENRDGINSFFPGGCTSFLYENLPTLTPVFGNQDLLWELFETIDGKILITKGYIGHIKSHSNRKSIIDDLKDSSYKHQTSVTYSTFQYLAKINGRKKGVLGFKNNFIDLMDKWLNESKDYTEQILRLVNNKNYWYADDSKYRSTKLIKMICSDFLNNYENIRSNYSCSHQDVSNLIFGYYKNKEYFDKILKYIVNEK